MATDIIARGMAANAKKSVTELGDKVESEKWIGTKAEWEAVDKSTIKDGTIVYITDDKTVILYDKAEMEKIAAKVAEDRTAAETAAQTAQSIADSLPEDYTTAVAKIAENTAEIANVKLTDKELQRRVNALYSIGQGITHQFETDSGTAYAKTVPTGAKLMSIKSVGGRSITFNQMYKKFDYVSGGILNCKPIFKSHKYLLRVDYSVSENTKVYLYFRDAKYTAETNRQIVKNVAAGSGKISWITSPLGEHSDGGDFGVFRMVTDSDGSQKLDTSPFSNHEIFDLTTMFGSRNEPSTVEDFLKFFPADYYPYNAGEIISAGTEEVVEQGKNLWDEVWGVGSINASSGNDEGSKEVIYSKNYTPIIPNSTYIFVYAGSASFENVKTRFYDHSKNYIGYNDNNGQTVYPNRAFITPLNAAYVRFTLPPGYGNVYKNDIALIAGSSGTYAPFHRNVYQIPEAIRNLPGYGVEGNVVDYEAKTYTQNNAVDGTEVKALDTPIVTDISNLIDDDFLRNIEVEAGGSITFKNGNDSYHIPVPSEEEYIVKLSEVGGTT